MNARPNLKHLLLGIAMAGTLTGAALAEDLVVTTPSAAAKDNVVGLASRDGIRISELGATVTRNGVTKQLAEPLKLSNGATVMPDGSIKNADGSHLTLRPDQLLTFDGLLINREDAIAQPEEAPVPVRPITR
jgi:hypothetical protein